MSSEEKELPILSPEELMSVFVTLAAEADLRAQRGNYLEAIDAYTRALLVRANDKNCLVSRSRCHLQVGDSASSLRDAEASLKEDPKFFKGLFLKAEALYAMGDFESALMFYHRGNKLRPELEEFRIGIQKSSEAIENSIGDPNCKIFISPAMKRTVLTLFANGNQSREDAELKKAANLASIPISKSSAKSNALHIPNTRMIGSSNGNAMISSVNANNPASVNAFLSHRGIIPPAQTSLTLIMESKLLGDLYDDKAYLAQLLSDKDLLEHPNDQVLRLVANGLQYFNTRIDFWRQQNPLYARHAHSVHARQVKRESTRKHGASATRKATDVTLPPIHSAQNNVRQISKHRLQAGTV